MDILPLNLKAPYTRTNESTVIFNNLSNLIPKLPSIKNNVKRLLNPHNISSTFRRHSAGEVQAVPSIEVIPPSPSSPDENKTFEIIEINKVFAETLDLCKRKIRRFSEPCFFSQLGVSNSKEIDAAGRMRRKSMPCISSKYLLKVPKPGRKKKRHRRLSLPADPEKSDFPDFGDFSHDIKQNSHHGSYEKIHYWENDEGHRETVHEIFIPGFGSSEPFIGRSEERRQSLETSDQSSVSSIYGFKEPRQSLEIGDQCADKNTNDISLVRKEGNDENEMLSLSFHSIVALQKDSLLYPSVRQNLTYSSTDKQISNVINEKPDLMNTPSHHKSMFTKDESCLPDDSVETTGGKCLDDRGILNTNKLVIVNKNVDEYSSNLSCINRQHNDVDDKKEISNRDTVGIHSATCSTKQNAKGDSISRNQISSSEVNHNIDCEKTQADCLLNGFGKKRECTVVNIESNCNIVYESVNQKLCSSESCYLETQYSNKVKSINATHFRDNYSDQLMGEETIKCIQGESGNQSGTMNLSDVQGSENDDNTKSYDPQNEENIHVEDTKNEAEKDVVSKEHMSPTRQISNILSGRLSDTPSSSAPSTRALFNFAHKDALPRKVVYNARNDDVNMFMMKNEDTGVGDSSSEESLEKVDNDDANIEADNKSPIMKSMSLTGLDSYVIKSKAPHIKTDMRTVSLHEDTVNDKSLLDALSAIENPVNQTKSSNESESKPTSASMEELDDHKRTNSRRVSALNRLNKDLAHAMLRKAVSLVEIERIRENVAKFEQKFMSTEVLSAPEDWDEHFPRLSMEDCSKCASCRSRSSSYHSLLYDVDTANLFPIYQPTVIDVKEEDKTDLAKINNRVNNNLDDDSDKVEKNSTEVATVVEDSKTKMLKAKKERLMKQGQAAFGSFRDKFRKAKAKV